MFLRPQDKTCQHLNFKSNKAETQLNIRDLNVLPVVPEHNEPSAHVLIIFSLPQTGWVTLKSDFHVDSSSLLINDVK